MRRSPRSFILRACALASVSTLVSCGGGSDTPEDRPVSTASEPVSTRAHALAATSTLPVRITQDTDPLFDGLTIPADAATKGMWSATQPWPMNGLHSVLLSNGKVLTFGTPQNAPGNQDGRTWDIWSPSQGFGNASHQTNYDAGRANSFCGAADWLGDGTLMTTGGNSPRNSAIFNLGKGTVVNDALALADERWYATMLTLPNGRPIIMGGMDPYQEDMRNNPDAAVANGTVSMTPEVYTRGVGWTSLTGARSRDAFGPDYLRASYPRAWVAPSGVVFGISAETMWTLDPAANGGAGAVTVQGKFKGPASMTAPVNVGATNSAVMFAPGRILQAGGNGYFNGDGFPASNMATVVDINGAAPVVTETTPMTNARRYINMTVLPDGKVVATGGTKFGNNGGGDAVYAAEIWNPSTGAWTVGASAAQIRVYHSAAILLPNATVLSTGGGAPGPVDNQNAEIYYPPYLFRNVNGTAQLAPRPALTGLSASDFGYGATLAVEMRDSTTIARLVLVANGTVTHSFNVGQRFLELPFSQSGDRLAATLPASSNLAPPGYYQLFALDAQGVPSRAATISLGLEGSQAASKPAFTTGSPYVFDSSNVTGQALAVDANGLGVLGSSGSPLPTTSQFVVRAGLADASCLSLESVSSPGKYYRHANYRLQLGVNDGGDLFKNDATFCPEPGLAGVGVTLRSKNFPGYVMRQRDGQVWIDVQAADAGFASSASFVPRLATTPLPTIGNLPAVPVASGSSVAWTPGLEADGLTFAWDFGDGSTTGWSSSASASHTYVNPGIYTVTFTVRGASGNTATRVFVQAVYAPPTSGMPRSSAQMLVESRATAAARLWVVNPDQNSVSVFDTSNNARLAVIAVGNAPRAVALSADGASVWVSNRDDASISVISTQSLAVTRQIALPAASQPHGLVISSSGTAYVVLEALGQLAKLDGNGATQATLSVGPRPRHLALSADGSRVLVSRFITQPLAGEATANVDTTSGGGEVVVVSASTMAVSGTVRLAHSDKADTEIGGSGIPNFLGAALISPDGKSAWVPSKQDNIRRGTLRNGLNLNFQNTVRAISSRIDLGSMTEVLASRIDHDNAGLASAGAYDPTGSYLFVALETARQVAVLDARSGAQLMRLETGLAPQAVAVSPDGLRLYVNNFMSRTISVFDLTALRRYGTLSAPLLAMPATVGQEALSAVVLRGKQLFYDARDTRLARDAYMSCASCHSENGNDGRTWDLTGLGEGLRNTISLAGHGGMSQGLLHWSGNFDEIQDFEKQIRDLAGGTGLMNDADYNTGTRNQAMGDKKAGISADLDALAAYMATLTVNDASPWRPAPGTLSAAGVAGKAVFAKAACATCHGGSDFTNSSLSGGMRNAGTLKASSGNRLGSPLTGLDVPTLRGVWATAPYLHDGSAPTLAAAVQAHANNTVTGTDLTNLVSYLQQIDGSEPAPAAPLPDGVYRLVAKHSNQVLDIAGISTASGAQATQWPWLGGDNQRWKIANLGNGQYTISAQHTGQRLEVASAATANGARVQQGPASNCNCQTWLIQTLGDGTFKIVNKNSGKVLDVLGISQTAGAAATQWDWLDGPNQHWRIEPVSANNVAQATYSLTAVHSGKVLDVAGISAASGAQVWQWDWLNGANQKWLVTPMADGFFELAPTHAPTMRLQVAGGGLVSGNLVQQGPASGSAAQRWGFTKQPDGSVTLTNVNSGRTLDVYGAAKANGTNTVQWDFNGGTNQEWTLKAQ